MSGYLRLKDYAVQTQQELTQIIGNDDSIRLLAEAQALEEVKSYLSQRYDTSREFKEIHTFNPLTPYVAGDRIEIILGTLGYSDHSSTATYLAGDKVIYASIAYFASVAITTPEAFNLTKWTKIGGINDLYFGAYPYPEFNHKTYYKIGDQVYWKGFTYTATKATSGISHEGALQIGSLEYLPTSGVFPDDLTHTGYWGSKTEHTIPTGSLPGTAYWTFGDSRNTKIVQVLVDIVIYTLWSRGAPRNIPPLRIDRYRSAINWLEMIARGEVGTSLPIIQPSTGSRIRFGGDVKNINGY
jgi:hypothetical protein